MTYQPYHYFARSLKKGKPKTHTFIEEKQPNWFQLPRDLRETLLVSELGSELTNLIETTPPFSESMGKIIAFPEFRTSMTDYSGADILRSILVSYLFAAGERRWKPKTFNRAWNDNLSHFNPKISSVEYCLYAPIAFMPGVSRRLDLGDGLSIRRLSVNEMARLGLLRSNTCWRLCASQIYIMAHLFLCKKNTLYETNRGNRFNRRS